MARFNEIVQILIRNDFWGLLQDMTKSDSQTAQQKAASDSPKRFKQILEDLGPTFIKLGQLLATRPDLVSERYVEELKNLYDDTEPSPFPLIKRSIEEQLQKPISAVFSTFEEQALASASVGQVHRATLRDGTKVAVKVQHVGIEESMKLDFEILRGLVTFMEKTFAATRIWQPTEHLEELRLMLERELDYTYELRNTKRVRKNFRGDPTVHIPRMYAQYCGPRMLVMEFVEGIKFANVDAPEMAGIDRKKVAKIITHSMARQIFVHRIFHADPSPGNMLILDSDKVAFLDFGAVGVVTERRSKAILRLINSLGKSDVEQAVEAVIDLCEQQGEFDHKKFVNDAERIIDYIEREEISVADPQLMEMILELARKHRMLLPSDFILINRALFQFEGFCRELDPDYELVDVLEPLVAEVLWKNIASTKKQKELVDETVGELLRFLRTFPHTLNTLTRKIERNELSTRIEISGLEGVKQAHGRSTLKMALTMMMSALVVGLGIVYAGPTPDKQVGQFLFGAGSIVVVWVIVMVFWSEAMKGNRE